MSRSESPTKKPPPRSPSPTKTSKAREAFAVMHAQELRDASSCSRLPGHAPDSAAACLAEAARDTARQLPSSSIMVQRQGEVAAVSPAMSPQGKVTAMPVTAMPRQGGTTTKAAQTPRRSVPLAPRRDAPAPEVPSVHGHGRHGPTVAQRKLVPQAVALLTDEEPCALFYDLDQLRTTLGSISAAFPPSATHVPECSNHFPWHPYPCQHTTS